MPRQEFKMIFQFLVKTQNIEPNEVISLKYDCWEHETSFETTRNILKLLRTFCTSSLLILPEK